MRSAVAILVASAVLGACGEPPIDIELVERPPSASVDDRAGILEGSDLSERLAALRDDGLDVVALTYETEQASCGEAFRAGGAIVEAWDADVALVAVARPGEFTATEEPRRRCLGIRPRTDETLPRSLRERIGEELVVEPASRNDWRGAFTVAVEALERRED